MRLDVLIDFLAFDNSQPTNDPADATKVRNRTTEDSIVGVKRCQISVPDSTVDQVIELPSANTEYLLILTDQEISIKLNGSGDSITLKPRAAGTKTAVYYSRGDVTALLLSNASGSAAKVDIVTADK